MEASPDNEKRLARQCAESCRPTQRMIGLSRKRRTQSPETKHTLPSLMSHFIFYNAGNASQDGWSAGGIPVVS